MIDKNHITSAFRDIQSNIIAALEKLDTGSFSRHDWQRAPESGVSYGGGGTSCLLQEGKVFEQGGVNFSAVQGIMKKDLCLKLVGSEVELPFFATGVSLVIHPLSPKIPTTHANIRYLEVGDYSWFGGGADLTPYYLDEEDAVHFHTEMKRWCDSADIAYYPKFKQWCDEYFFLSHRQEGRGIGGVFFDYLGRDDKNKNTLSDHYKFALGMGQAFVRAYTPLVEKHVDEPFTEEERNFQLWRRGRYVEFNLLYDKGTRFGLETGGRIQSILMSLPPLVRWNEEKIIEPDTKEDRLLKVLRTPRDWIGNT
jgi:coproporphyrinogen III oxidase